MSLVLYRKYRSQNFNELIGQGHITEILKNSVKTGNISHAYLLTGARGTGKTSTARIIAKAINCLNPTKDGNPCNECTVCDAITRGNFLDLIEVDAASNRGIDQIRELKERIEYRPTEGKYKVYIIDEVHMLTNEAFNALLKTLEEPPAHIVFILATTDAHKLPATILSRCQRYDFRLGTDEQVRDVITKSSESEGVKLTEGALKILVENARGSYRDALSLLDVLVSGQKDSDRPDEITEAEVRTVLGVPDSTMVYYLLEKLVEGNSVAALDLISELDSKGINLQQFVKYVLKMLREILVQKIRGGIDPKEYSFAVSLTDRNILSIINLFLEADRNLKNASIPALTLEMLIPSVSIALGENTQKPVNISKGPTLIGIKKTEDSNSEKSEVKKEEEPKSDVKQTRSVKEVDSQIVSQKKASNIKISFEDITSNWKKITNEIKPANGHLFAFLEGAKLVGLEEDKLKLEVPFAFHKDRITEPKSRKAISEVFKNVLGGSVELECVVNNTIKRRNKVTADTILKSVQAVQEQAAAVKKESESKSEAKIFSPRAKGVPKEIEEIFAGL